jgi:hypothetical protein
MIPGYSLCVSPIVPVLRMVFQNSSECSLRGNPIIHRPRVAIGRPLDRIMKKRISQIHQFQNKIIIVIC